MSAIRSLRWQIRSLRRQIIKKRLCRQIRFQRRQRRRQRRQIRFSTSENKARRQQMNVAHRQINTMSASQFTYFCYERRAILSYLCYIIIRRKHHPLCYPPPPLSAADTHWYILIRWGLHLKFLTLRIHPQ